MKKKILTITLFLLMILAVSGCLDHIDRSSKKDINKNYTSNYTSESFFREDLEIVIIEYRGSKIYSQTIPSLKLNKKPQFTVGDIFVYTWDVYVAGKKEKYYTNRLTGKKYLFIRNML